MDCRCPRRLKSLPDKACDQGREAVDLSRKGKIGGCPWFISDPEYHYCFFKLMDDDGFPMTTNRVSRMLMMDDTEVKRILQNVRRKLPDLIDDELLE